MVLEQRPEPAGDLDGETRNVVAAAVNTHNGWLDRVPATPGGGNRGGGGSGGR